MNKTKFYLQRDYILGRGYRLKTNQSLYLSEVHAAVESVPGNVRVQRGA